MAIGMWVIGMRNRFSPTPTILLFIFFLLTAASPATLVAGTGESVEGLLATARRLVARYADPSSPRRLANEIAALSDFDSREVAVGFLSLYTANEKHRNKLLRKERAIRGKLAEIPRTIRSRPIQVRKDLLTCWQGIVADQISGTLAMKRSILDGLSRFESEAAVDALGKRLRKGGDVDLMEALSRRICTRSLEEAIPILLAALGNCRASARTPIFVALEELTGEKHARRPDTWKRWWSRRQNEGGDR